MIQRLLKSNERGYAYVILAAVLWAVSGSSSKFLFHSGIAPLELAHLRITLSASLLFVWMAIFQRHNLMIEKKDSLIFIWVGLLMAAVQFTYLYAISKIQVAAAILLQYMAPALIALYSVIIAKETLGKYTAIAVTAATVGCYFVVGGYNLNILMLNRAGIISGLLSAIAFAWYSIKGEYVMRRYNPLTVVCFAFLFGAIPFNIIISPVNIFTNSYSSVQWIGIVYIAMFGTVIPFGLYFAGINLIRSTRASITATLEPITAGVISYIFLGETMELFQMMGGILVISSIILLQVTKEQVQMSPELIRSQLNQQSWYSDHP